ncbi:ArsC family transcriptional regulator [Croceibacterium mercuriale]|uniref:ArsC family transcriptional regulator n=1 Tax=Croceibacterium mercuriale TaxID=1572751 RepID=A0A0B2BS37_9SPHN|nr:arsenate reductase [Croceibacterium mercuriale]KHL24398.1 ArsC family transcriptional regulator [Croceibacterium mercuriale]
MMVLYGIPNCDTVKRARAWLDGRGIAYTFHDYKREGASPALLTDLASHVGWDALLNRRGTTFRKLDEAARADLSDGKVLGLMTEQPSLIRRPVVMHGGKVLVGFDPAEWERAFSDTGDR